MDEQSRRRAEKLKKRSLKRYRKNLECVARLEEKLALLETRIVAIKSPSLSGMPRGGVPVSLDDLITDKDDLVDRIKRLKAKSRTLKRAVCEEIDTLEDPRYCDVLEAYFVECLTFEQIADELGYTERHVISLYSEAITLLSLSDQ